MNWKIGKRLGGIFLLAGLSLTLVACGGNSADQKDKSSAAAGSDKKVIRVAHTQAYVPYDFVNDKGESDGFEVAVMKEVAKLMPEYSFEFVPTSDDDLLIGVESGKYDVGTKGAWLTEARKEKFIFPKEPVGASIIGIVFRKDNGDQIKDIESFAKFSGKLVPIAPQNAQYNVIEAFNKTHPQSPISLVSSEAFTIADAYTWVLEGRYDAYVDIELSYKNNVEKADGPYHNLADKLSFVRYKAIPTYPLFNKKDQAFADAYDQAVSQLKANGKIKELEEKYFGEDLFQYVKE